jgi:ribose-phosphate pyrophosphokinase
LASYFKKKELDDLVVVSPDVGRVKMAKKYADKLGAQLAILHKTRPAHNLAEVTHVIGKVKGRPALIIDDMVDTAGTIVGGAETLIEKGAREVYACATHPLLSGPAMKRIAESPIKELVVTNTLPIPSEKMIDKFKILSIAPLFAQAIRNVHEDKSVSQLFEGDEQP